MTMKRIFIAFLLSLCGISAVNAEVMPSAGYRDTRVKTVAYDENDVVKVVGRYGYSTVIEFAPGEVVTDVALGDTLAWEVAPSKNNVFVKPREDKAATNMTVVTDKRVYHFMLQAARHTNTSPKDAFFAVRFKYPAEEAAKLAAEREAQQAKAALAIQPKPVNWDYWACGARQLRPTEVYDDGRFTYLRFPGAQEIPAVFIINSDNSESLANGQMRGDKFVVYATAKKLILRKGKSVACVENRNFNWYGIYTDNGTTSPHVQRTVQGIAPAPPVRTVPAEPAEEEDEDSSPRPLPMPMPAMPMPMPMPALPGSPDGPATEPGGAMTPGVGAVPQASPAAGTGALVASVGPAKFTILPPATLNRPMAEVLHAKHGKE
jgi:type IV secretion system protein VirB9